MVVEERREHERPPLNEITKNIIQTARGQATGSITAANGPSAVRGRGSGKGQGSSFISNHSVLVFLLSF